MVSATAFRRGVIALPEMDARRVRSEAAADPPPRFSTVLLAAAWMLAALASLPLALPPGHVAPLWAPAGIAFAGLWRYGWRLWPGVFAAALLTHLLISMFSGVTPAVAFAVAVSFALAASLQAVVANRLLVRLMGPRSEMLAVREVLQFLFVGGPLASLLGATWGVATLYAAGLLDERWLVTNWWGSWLGNTIGVLALTPVVLAFTGPREAVWRARRATVAVPLALLSAALVWIYVDILRQERAFTLLEQDARAERVEHAVQQTLVRYLEVLHAIESFYAGSDDVSAEHFRVFVTRTLERVPGIQALSWNPVVPADSRAAFVAQARGEGIAGFRVTERDANGALVAAGERAQYVVVRYIEPQADNAAAIGFDVASDTVRGAALERALVEAPIATARITLVQETADQFGVLTFLPIYRGGERPDTLEARRRALRGYAVGVFRLGDMLASSLRNVAVGEMLVQLSDVTDTGVPVPLAAVRVDAARQVANVATPGIEGVSGHEWTRERNFGGRRWRVQVTAADMLAGAPGLGSWLVLAAGTVVAGLLHGFLLVLSGRSESDVRHARELGTVNADLRAEVTRRERTERALHAEKERAEVTLHSIGDAVITTDEHGRVQFLNPVAETLTGWPLHEATGRALRDVFRIVDEASGAPGEDPVARCLRENRIVTLDDDAALVERRGRRYSVQVSAAPIRDDDDGAGFGAVLVFNDVTETRRQAAVAAHHASHDVLTGLVNRREFESRLRNAVASARERGAHHALGYIDLDQFKIVNDSAGHAAGDELLRRLATVLASMLRERDTLARLGGDEFGLLLDNCPSAKAHEIARGLIDAVAGFDFEWRERRYRVGASIGLVSIAGDVDAGELLSQADVACYTAKDLGRNRVHVYAGTANGVADPRHTEILRAADLRMAIECNRFRLYCQPICDLSGERPVVAHHEVLLRVLDGDDGVHRPEDFIAAAERYGLMAQVDRWVLAKVLGEHRRFAPHCDGMLSINLSGNSLDDESLPAFIEREVAASGLPPERLCFEITETAAVRHLEAAERVVQRLRGLGCRLALDDFGTGLSSFGYLKRLSVDYLKIDASFVSGMGEDAGDRAIVRAIHELGRELGMRTIAEGVESVQAVAALRELGIEYGQGYALGRPSPVAAADESSAAARRQP